MVLFNFQPDEWAFFMFILGSLAIYTGAIGGYGEHMGTWSFAQLLEWPLNTFVVPVFNSQFAIFTPLAFIAVLWAVLKFANFVDPAIMGAVLFGVVVLALGA